jgi:hypothetical protein
MDQLELLLAASERIRARDAQLALDVAASGAAAPYGAEAYKSLRKSLERVG